MVQDVEHASGKPSFGKDTADGPEAARRELGALQDCGVASGESVKEGTDAENIGCVPVIVSVPM